jgi:hypothetical protein
MTTVPQSVFKNMTTKQFDFCRDDERFAEIKNRLMAVACEDISARK